MVFWHIATSLAAKHNQISVTVLALFLNRQSETCPMKHHAFSRIALACSGAVLALFAHTALAQTYPNKPIRLVVPFAPGGTTDIVARAVGEALGKELGQPVLIENRAGGGGSVGADAVAKATPDGYTLGVASVSTMATNPATNAKNPYNPITDFAPITNLATVPNVMTCNPNKVAAKDLKELIALFKSAPGKYSYASSGIGGISHLDGELFKQLTARWIVS
jgi:tripartite-type tricarboxylate transporter receptor subunit TctC